MIFTKNLYMKYTISQYESYFILKTLNFMGAWFEKQ